MSRAGRAGLHSSFASPASPIDYLKIPIQTLKVSALETHNCLGLALEKRQQYSLPQPVKCMVTPLVHPQTRRILGQCEPSRA